MSTEDLQKKYDRLFERVKRVRGWQKEYARYHIDQDRQMMIRNVRELDDMLKVEEMERKTKQKQLF